MMVVMGVKSQAVLNLARCAHPGPAAGVTVVGLLLSVAMMGVASVFIARLLTKHRWIAWVGLVVILYVAIKMMYEGGHDLLPFAQSVLPT